MDSEDSDGNQPSERTGSNDSVQVLGVFRPTSAGQILLLQSHHDGRHQGRL